MNGAEMPTIRKQARVIVYLYKLLGLYSIPILTLVTIISISNVFVRGQLATWSWLEIVWAVIFAAAIEVNIVRLFFEWKLDNDQGAKWLGIILALVAGVALLIEGLQQSIGFDWSNIFVQSVIGLVIALRVLVVVLLLAREGSKLASSMGEDVQPLYACLVHFAPPSPPESVQDIEHTVIHDTEQPLHIVPAQKPVSQKRTVTAQQLRKMRTLITTDPRIPVRTLADKVGVSPGTASKYKNSIANEA